VCVPYISIDDWLRTDDKTKVGAKILPRSLDFDGHVELSRYIRPLDSSEEKQESS
jgi:hypothetical protein